MLYEFACSVCGHAEAIVLPVTQAPPIGSNRGCGQCRGNTLTRVASVPQVATARMAAAGKYPYVSRQHSGLPTCEQTPEGHSVIQSQQHEREVMARTGLVRD